MVASPLSLTLTRDDRQTENMLLSFTVHAPVVVSCPFPEYNGAAAAGIPAMVSYPAFAQEAMRNTAIVGPGRESRGRPPSC